METRFTNSLLKLGFILTGLTIMNAQSPALQWQKALGGSSYDQAYSIQQTTEGGYIVAGSTSSKDGDVTGYHSDPNSSFVDDFWIVKLNESGTLQWQKALGGSNSEVANAVKQTNDGGYIIAGFTSSNDADVSGNHSSNNDFWIVKISSSGNIEWQKTLGGTGNDRAQSIQQTSDGGYIVAGSTESLNGDVTGYHGTFGEDYWVVKLSALGIIEWQKALGGKNHDRAYSVRQTADGGYIVAGESNSLDGDVGVGNHGSGNSPTMDYWIVKLNSTGNIEWKKIFGGKEADSATEIQQTTDGGYIVAGISSSNDGDVSGNHLSSGGFPTSDYWVVKLTNSGNIEWQKSLGGSGQESGTGFLVSIQQTYDGGFIVAGESGSNNGDVSGNHGGKDYWVVRLNMTGSILWQKTLGGTFGDIAQCVRQTADGGYIIAGYTGSSNGDVSGYHSGFDFWIVKLNPDAMSVNDIKTTENLSIYPNPVKDMITINGNLAKNTKAFIYDINGQIVKQINEINNQMIEVENLATGSYILEIIQNHKKQSIKFIKK